MSNESVELAWSHFVFWELWVCGSVFFSFPQSHVVWSSLITKEYLEKCVCVCVCKKFKGGSSLLEGRWHGKIYMVSLFCGFSPIAGGSLRYFIDSIPGVPKPGPSGPLPNLFYLSANLQRNWFKWSAHLHPLRSPITILIIWIGCAGGGRHLKQAA